MRSGGSHTLAGHGAKMRLNGGSGGAHSGACDGTSARCGRVAGERGRATVPVARPATAAVCTAVSVGHIGAAGGGGGTAATHAPEAPCSKSVRLPSNRESHMEGTGRVVHVGIEHERDACRDGGAGGFNPSHARKGAGLRAVWGRSRASQHESRLTTRGGHTWFALTRK